MPFSTVLIPEERQQINGTLSTWLAMPHQTRRAASGFPMEYSTKAQISINSYTDLRLNRVMA
jgi:hypothetical protein